MEYQNLILYPNLYPNVDNYGKTLDGSVSLVGKYESDNIVSFKIPSLNDLEIIDNTSFKFILAIKESEISDETRYFISPPFFDDLLASISENNPYFINNALNENLFVNVTLDNQLKLFNDLKLIDFGTGVKQNQNLFIIADNTIDYITLVQYIDWVCGKVNPLDDENNGVLPAEKIADYEIGEYDSKTGEFIPNSAKAVALAQRLEKLNDELVELDEAIAAMEGDIPAEPQKRKTSALDIISLGLGAVSVLQGVSAASKALKAANTLKNTKGAIDIVKTTSSIKPLPPVNVPAPKLPDFAQMFPGYNVGAIPTTKITGFANKAKQFARTAKNAVGSATKFVTTQTKQVSQLIARTAQTDLGAAAIRTGIAVNGIVQSSKGAVQPKGAVAVKVAKEIRKTAFTELGKAVVKKAITKGIIKGVGAKILGAATGPIGAGIMAAVGIVKFFVNKKKQKKEYQKQKAEYDKVMSELNRLLKRKEEVEFEINSILKSGKLTLDGKPKGDERLSSTQKYFQNIGKKILEAKIGVDTQLSNQSEPTPELAVAEETITQPIRRPSRFARRSLGD